MATVSFDLSDFSSFTINGVSPYDTSGYSVSNAGDINKETRCRDVLYKKENPMPLTPLEMVILVLLL